MAMDSASVELRACAVTGNKGSASRPPPPPHLPDTPPHSHPTAGPFHASRPRAKLPYRDV